MLTSVNLQGELGERFGTQFKLAVKSPGQALRLLRANFPDIHQFLVDQANRGVDYRVVVDKEDIGEDQINFERRTKSITFTPVVAGSKSGIGKIILGAILIVAAFYTGGATGAFMSTSVGSTTVGSIVGSIGISLALSGIAQLVSPLNTGIAGSNQGGTEASDLFDGPVNVARQGGPVPLFYGGPLVVGSMVISAGRYAEVTGGHSSGIVVTDEDGNWTSLQP